MKIMNKLFAFLKQPKLWFLITLYVLTLGLIAVALAFVITGYTENVFAYIIYAFTALFLGYTVYTVVKFFPTAKSNIVSKISSHRVAANLIEDKRLRNVVFAGISLVINLGYALFNGIVAIKGLSIWFGALAGYYFLLAILRGSVVLAQRKDKDDLTRQLKLYRMCGIVLPIIILVLSLAIMQMVAKNESFKYAGLMIYVGALYTFLKVTVAIVNFVKAKRRKDVTVETIKNINLADAAVAVLALQTAMFQAFGKGENMALANAATGAAVCAFILGMSVYMIISASLKLKKLKKEPLYERR